MGGGGAYVPSLKWQLKPIILHIEEEACLYFTLLLFVTAVAFSTHLFMSFVTISAVMCHFFMAMSLVRILP